MIQTEYEDEVDNEEVDRLTVFCADHYITCTLGLTGLMPTPQYT